MATETTQGQMKRYPSANRDGGYSNIPETPESQLGGGRALERAALEGSLLYCVSAFPESQTDRNKSTAATQRRKTKTNGRKRTTGEQNEKGVGDVGKDTAQIGAPSRILRLVLPELSESGVLPHL